MDNLLWKARTKIGNLLKRLLQSWRERMAPWSRKMVVEVTRNVRFVSGDKSLGVD